MTNPKINPGIYTLPKKAKTKTGLVEATAKHVAEGRCPKCGFPTSRELVDAIKKMVEQKQGHTFPFQDVRWCPKCRKMWYILPPGVKKEEKT